jgi:protein phosphatase
MAGSESDTSDYKDPSRFFVSTSEAVRVEFGARSDVGRARPVNEDHFVVIRRSRQQEALLGNVSLAGLPTAPDEAFLLALADGMGGAAFGEVASTLALRLLWELGHRSTQWIMKFDQRDEEDLRQRIAAMAESVHGFLLERARSNPAWAGMGTTLTAVYTMGLDAVTAHVGDSRAYHYRQGTLQQLTQDHTLAQELIKSGISAAEAAPYRNILTKCIGGPAAESSEVHQTYLRLQDGDRLLLCSDGLTDLVTNEEIAGVLAEQSRSQDACDVLVNLALERGGRDNVTVLVAAYSAAAPPEN